MIFALSGTATLITSQLISFYNIQVNMQSDTSTMSGLNSKDQKTHSCEQGSSPGGGGGEVLPYIVYIGMCRCEGYGFQAVYFRIGYINQSVWV